MRANPSVGEKVLAFIRDHAAKSVFVIDGLIGCPHEEGIVVRLPEKWQTGNAVFW